MPSSILALSVCLAAAKHFLESDRRRRLRADDDTEIFDDTRTCDAVAPEGVELDWPSVEDTYDVGVRNGAYKVAEMSDSEGDDGDERPRFDAERSAYLLRMDFLDDNDRNRCGRVSLVAPEEVAVDSNIKDVDGTELVSSADILAARSKSYVDKVQWFSDTCARLRAERNEGRVRLTVRRDNLLSDSMQAVMSLTRKDMRKSWRFEFLGESVVDGSPTKEWFGLVTEGMFDPSTGMWQTSATDPMRLQINPASVTCLPGDHLIYFRFMGRVIGKALFDRQPVKYHMAKHLYKHILGWLVTFDDLKDVDEGYHRALKGLQEMGPHVEYACVDFTVAEETSGAKTTVELIPGGAGVGVTEDNLPEYIEACLKYRLLGRHEAQLNELLLGLFDVIPRPLLAVFDFRELEWLMCGHPDIDVDDWMEHTGPRHQVCIRLWEIAREYDREMRARLLRFVTGMAGVPERGFGSLGGSDGIVGKFTIYGSSLNRCVYPKSHTSSNRIDLPLYDNREECKEKLKIAITTTSTGFDISPIFSGSIFRPQAKAQRLLSEVGSWYVYMRSKVKRFVLNPTDGV